MSKFLQLHILTNYGPSNLNRDDLNRPKTAIVGGVQRLRISSQCLKRAWRTSDVFEKNLAGHIGIRTKSMGQKVYEELINGGIKEQKANEWAVKIAGVFGKNKVENKKEQLEIEQLAHFSTDEIAAIEALTKTMISRNNGPSDEELHLLQKNRSSVDIAMFGRMLAKEPSYNAEAAVQVAHAFTIHKTAIEDDYFSAVDDLNKHDEHSGSGHIGEAEFGSGIYYLYICIDRSLLTENLAGNKELAGKAVKALVEAVATVSPSGKQSSFASRAYAFYIMAEKGDNQPRSLAGSFIKPVSGDDIAIDAIRAVKEMRRSFNKVYCDNTQEYEINILTGDGSLNDLKEYCVGE